MNINAQTFTPIANGGSFTLTISAGQNLWIKFISDVTGSTFNFVQLEEGSVATPFEQRPYGLELSLCQRYYETGRYGILNINYGTANVGTLINFKNIKRVTPTVTREGSAILQNINIFGFEFFQNTAANSWAIGTYVASAEL